MQNHHDHPRWWALYLLCAIVLGLFWLQARAPLSPAGHTWAGIGLVLLLYSMVWLWLELNRAALYHEGREQRRRALRRDLEPLRHAGPDVYRFDPRQTHIPDAGRVAIFSTVLAWIAHFFGF